MSHFDRFAREIRLYLALTVFAVVLLSALASLPQMVGHYGPTAIVSHYSSVATIGHYGSTIVSHFGQPSIISHYSRQDAPSGYHGPVATVSHYGQPTIIAHW